MGDRLGETHFPCKEGKVCLPSKDCQPFLDAARAFNEEASPLKKATLLRVLKTDVCNRKGKGGCCPNSFLLPVPPPKSFTCGERPGMKVDGLIDVRVVGGETVTSEEAPWQVLLEKKENEGGKKITVHCGGTIIGPRHVLTAGHCLWVSSVSSGSFITFSFQRNNANGRHVRRCRKKTASQCAEEGCHPHCLRIMPDKLNVYVGEI